jgi:hypothetical protein
LTDIRTGSSTEVNGHLLSESADTPVRKAEVPECYVSKIIQDALRASARAWHAVKDGDVLPALPGICRCQRQSKDIENR